MTLVKPHQSGGGPQGAPTGAPLLDVRRLTKYFNGARALFAVDLLLHSGEVHGLLGANGSGKSTLIKILAGFHRADGGSVAMNGEVILMPFGPRGLREYGMGFVHQDLGLLPTSTVLEHMVLDAFGSSNGLSRIAWREERKRVTELLDRFDVKVTPDTPIERLTPVQWAMVAVVRAVGEQVAGSGQVLVLDEPTVFLPRGEVEVLFGLLERFKAEGNAVLFVSHDIDEVLQATDRVTVLRDGENTGTKPTLETTRQDLVEMILGARDEHVPAGKAAASRDHRIMSVDRISGARINDLSLTLHEGEVVGVTGLAGSGFEELPNLLYGAESMAAGKMEVEGKVVDRPSPAKMMQLGVVLIPADRKGEGGVLDLTVMENMALPFVGARLRGWHIRWAELRNQAFRTCKRLAVTPPNVRLPFGNLSGGNQQKALLGKWLDTKPRVMLLNEPTQGVDVGARREIFRLIREAVADGMTVLCVTSEYEQLVEMADRVVVLKDGRIHRELLGSDINKEELATAVYAEDSA